MVAALLLAVSFAVVSQVRLADAAIWDEKDAKGQLTRDEFLAGAKEMGISEDAAKDQMTRLINRQHVVKWVGKKAGKNEVVTIRGASIQERRERMMQMEEERKQQKEKNALKHDKSGHAQANGFQEKVGIAVPEATPCGRGVLITVFTLALLLFCISGMSYATGLISHMQGDGAVNGDREYDSGKLHGERSTHDGHSQGNESEQDHHGVARRVGSIYKRPCYLLGVPILVSVLSVGASVYLISMDLVTRRAMVVFAGVALSQFGRRVLAFFLRQCLLYSYVGWSSEMLQKNLRKTADVREMSDEERRRTHRVDAVVRRFEHVFFAYLDIVITSVLVSIPDRMLVRSLMYLLITSVRAFTLLLSTGCGSFLRGIMFPGARFLDGSVQFYNVLHVSAYSTIGVWLTDVLIGPCLIGPIADGGMTLSNMNIFWYTVVGWGDAAAELVGSFWGKHRFAVTGMGDINRKSLEGCAAFVVFSFAALLISVATVLELTWNFMALSLACSLVGMVFETISPRSTDNLTIGVSVALTVYAWLAIPKVVCSPAGS